MARMAESSEPMALRAAEQALKKLTNHLTCPVCLEPYHNPRVLSCFHVLCEKCLDGLIQVVEGAASMDCPTCRQRTVLPQNDASSLPSAFHMNYLFEIQDTLKQAKPAGARECGSCKKTYVASTCSYCYDCGHALCATCAEDHRSTIDHQIDTSTTSVAPVAAKTVRSVECRKHEGKTLDLFCETCEELICCECMFRSHKDSKHHCSLAADAYSRQKEAMAFCSKLLEQQQGAIEKVVANIDIESRQIENQQMVIQADIIKTIEQLQSVLEDRKMELISQLDQLTQQKKKSLAGQRDQFELVQTRLQSCLGFINKTLTSGSKEELLSTKKPVMKQIEEISAKITDMPSAPIEKPSMKFVVEEVKRQACSTLGEVYTTTQTPCPSKCTASGEGLAISKVGKLSAVTLELQDHYGTETEDPKAIVCGQLKSCTDSSLIECSIEKSEKNTYVITYRPAVRGEHQLHITVNSAHIQGSPFNVRVRMAMRLFGTPLRTIAGLNHPWGIAIDPIGQLFVAESKGKQISMITPGGERFRITGEKWLFERQFEQPGGIDLAGDGNLLATDISYSNVQLCTSEGKLLRSVGNMGSKQLQFTYPVGIKLNATNGKIYVTEWESNHRVQILNPDLSYHKMFGTKGSGKGQFASPSDIAFDRKGNAYVVDSDNHRIEVFTADGKYLSEFGRLGTKEGRLCLPSSICIDSDDRVYVTEAENHRVSIFSSEGQFVRSFGSHGNQPGQFCHPRGIAVDAEGFLYISDSNNDRVQVF